jgi:hypothetical protein
VRQVPVSKTCALKQPKEFRWLACSVENAGVAIRLGFKTFGRFWRRSAEMRTVGLLIEHTSPREVLLMGTKYALMGRSESHLSARSAAEGSAEAVAGTPLDRILSEPP